MIFRDKAHCIRSTGLQSKYKGERCVNRQCDRHAGPKVLELASKAGVPIGWADLRTSRCGFIADEKAFADQPRNEEARGTSPGHEGQDHEGKC